MRGTNDRAVFEDFVRAIQGFPPARRNGEDAETVFNNSYALLVNLEDKLPRAKAWRAYALAITVSEGWTLRASVAPEDAALNSAQRIGKSRKMVEEAIKLDPTDYDLWWAKGNVELIGGNPSGARVAFREALYLNQDEVNPNLLAEAADAAVHLGDFAWADRLTQLAFARPDWHHWILAWKHFMLARALPANEPVMLDLALAELDDVKRRAGQSGYLPDMLLLRAAIHARRWQFFAKLQPDEDVGTLAPISASGRAARERTSANRVMAEFLGEFPGWTKDRAIAFAPFVDDGDRKFWEESLDWAISA